jgi:membrane-associated phospholipid phosphatase
MILLDSAVHLSFFQHIIHFDYWLFGKINQQWTNSFLDTVFPYIREAEIWVPFYLFLLVYSTLNFGKKGWWWSLAVIMTAIISDLTSSSFIKNNIIRLRPCHEPLMAQTVRLLVTYCPMSSSFTSSHACNHFAVSVFIFLTLKKISTWWRLIFLWAAVISYAQIYVGVHYPLDVLGGTIVGCCIGYGTSFFFRKQIGSLSLQQ